MKKSNITMIEFMSMNGKSKILKRNVRVKWIVPSGIDFHYGEIYDAVECTNESTGESFIGLKSKDGEGYAYPLKYFEMVDTE